MKQNRIWLILLLCCIFSLHGWAEEESAPRAKAVKIKALFPAARDLDPAMTQEEYMEYGREDLFDYINGGAEVYLDLDFIKVGACDYCIELEEEIYFTLDVYDMKEPINAYGIFSSEKYGTPPTVAMGVSGYMGGGALNFWSRNFYVKIRADDEGDAINAILKKMASHVAERIGEPGKAPEELALFPARYKTKEKYAGNLLGMAFLRGFNCVYKNQDEELELYLFHYDSLKKAEKTEALFVKKLKTPPKPDKDGAGLLFSEKYLGKGKICRMGAYLIVIQGLPEPGKKSHAWKTDLIQKFHESVTEATMREKALNALGYFGGKKE